MKKKLKEWLKRYILAEIVSTILSVGTAWIIKVSFDENVIAAFAGSIMASVGFYGIIAFNDIRKNIKHHQKHGIGYGIIPFLKDFRNLIVEFGPAEILDVVVIRPFFMYFVPKLTSNFLMGTFIGKIIADIAFYIPAIIMYEVRKKHFPDMVTKMKNKGENYVEKKK